MKLSYLIIYVEDAMKAAEFYSVAFGLKTKFVHESKQYVEMETDSVTLAFASAAMLEMNLGLNLPQGARNSSEIGFTSLTVALDYENAIKAGALELKKPEVKPWGQAVGYVRDPFGNLIEICSPMS